MSEISQQIQDFIKPQTLKIHSANDLIQYRPKTSSNTKQSQKTSLISNFNIITPHKIRQRSISQQPYKIANHSSQKKRTVRRYLNGGSDTLSIETRQAMNKTQSFFPPQSSKQNNMRPANNVDNLLKSFSSQKQNIQNQELQHQIENQPNKQQDNQGLILRKIDSTVSVGFDDGSQDRCYEFDSTFLENLTLSDVQVQKMLQDLSLGVNHTRVDIERIVLQNQDYLHHVLLNCACFKCECGRCRCNYAAIKLTYKNGFKTVYGREYNKNDQPTLITTPLIKQSHYETLSKVQIPDQSDLELQKNTSQTTNQRFFQAYPLQQRYKRTHQNYVNIPFIATSTYQQTFHNWQDYDPGWKFSRPQHPFIQSQIPLKGQTNYSSDYSGSKQQLDPNFNSVDIKKKQQHETFLKEYPHQTDTEYKKTYQMQSSYEIPQRQRTLTQEYDPISSFQSQYSSVAKKSYVRQNQQQCRAQKMMKLKLLQNKQIQDFMVQRIKNLKEKSLIQ